MKNMNPVSNIYAYLFTDSFGIKKIYKNQEEQEKLNDISIIF